MSGNLKDFFTKEVRIISDPEGRDIMEMAKKDNENIVSTNYNILVLGDIIDSTNVSKEDKSSLNFNITNLINCVNNKQIKYVFGNRDINKLKVLPLSELKSNDTNEFVKKFNLCNFNNQDDLIKIYNNLKLSTDLWLIPGMNHWYTFWSPEVGYGKKWDDYGYTDNKIFITRFNEIFGRDNSDGTMSAQNLLESITSELKIEGVNIDFKAFVVLIIFRLMLLKHEMPNYEKINNNNLQNLKGLLYNFFKKGLSCAYYNHEDNLYLFSHGGIPVGMIEKPHNISDYYNKIFENNNNNIIELITNYREVSNQTGGGACINITNKLDDFNNFINIKINEIFDNYININNNQIPTNEILFMLMISAPFECKKILQNVNGVKRDSSGNIIKTSTLIRKNKNNYNCNDFKDSVNISPFAAHGIKRFQDINQNLVFCDNKHIYQIFGHVPVGYSACFISYKQPNKIYKTTLINLDTSNSFANTSINDNSKTIIIFINNDLKLYSTIKLKQDKILIKSISDLKNKNFNSKKSDNNIFSSNSDIFNLICEQSVQDIMIKSNKINTSIIDISEKKKYYYHGQYNNKYHVVTYLVSGFIIALLILTDDEFTDMFRDEVVTKGDIKGGTNFIKYKLLIDL
jgi:hypothetical protein